HLLEDRIGDAVIDHQLLLPLTIAVRAVKLVENIFDLGVHAFAELFGSELETRFNLLGVLFDGDLRILVFIVENPAFAFGNNAISELGLRDLVSPLAESTFGEFLNVAFVHERHRRAIAPKGKLDRTPHQSLRPGDRDRLDADAGVLADTLLA